VRNGTREVLAGLSQVSWEREEPSYKETKAKEAGRCRSRHAASYNRNNVEAAMADETILLMMSMQQKILGGKGLC
jgi:hypothetical protein